MNYCDAGGPLVFMDCCWSEKSRITEFLCKVVDEMSVEKQVGLFEVLYAQAIDILPQKISRL